MNVFFTLLVLAAASAQEPLLPAFVLAGRADLPAGARGGHCRGAARGGPRAAPGRSRLPHGARRVRRRRRRATAAGGAPTLAALVAARPSVELALDQGQGGVGVSRSPLVCSTPRPRSRAAPRPSSSTPPRRRSGSWTRPCRASSRRRSAPRARPSSSSSRARPGADVKGVVLEAVGGRVETRRVADPGSLVDFPQAKPAPARRPRGASRRGAASRTRRPRRPASA